MAYDEELAHRIRTVLAGEPGVSERAMFGGLGFMVDGHMAVAASSTGGLMVRVDPAVGEQLADGDTVVPMKMAGRTMAGWLLVDSAAVADDSALRSWADRGVAYVRTLPPKG